MTGDKETNSSVNADRPDTEERKGTGFFSVLGSVMAAGFGVQSRENRERDFQQGKAIHFIVGGLIGTLVFILAIVFLVKILLASV